MWLVSRGSAAVLGKNWISLPDVLERDFLTFLLLRNEEAFCFLFMRLRLRASAPLGLLARATLVLVGVSFVVFFLQTLAGGYLANAYASREAWTPGARAYGNSPLPDDGFGSYSYGSRLGCGHVDVGGPLYIAPACGRARAAMALGRNLLPPYPSSLFPWQALFLGSTRVFRGWVCSALLGRESTEYLEMGGLWRAGVAGGFTLWIIVLTPRCMKGESGMAAAPTGTRAQGRQDYGCLLCHLCLSAHESLGRHRFLTLLGRPPLGGGHFCLLPDSRA